MGVRFDALTEQEVLVKVEDFLESQGQYLVVTPNPEVLLASLQNRDFSQLLNGADLSIADGIGILWAATVQKFARKKRSQIWIYLYAIWALFCLLVYPRFCRRVLPERVTGTDMMIKIAGKVKARVFLLGADEGVAEKAAEKLKKTNPDLEVVGTYSGTPLPRDEKEIIAKIKAVRPEILWVAYGSPTQELWLKRNLSKLPSVKVGMGIGGAFDFIAGGRKRAPKIWRKLGLEWLFRLLIQPRRVWRIYRAVVVFPVRFLIVTLSRQE